MTTTLGHYRLDDEVGSGAMGSVFKAMDTRLNRVVAIKVWRPGHGLMPDAARRMLKEARAVSALNHPNIVIVHDFGENENGDTFIVQEFIHGATLRERLAARIPLAECLEIGSQTARALAAAHDAGIVHRDIKPENLMIRRDGYVKVLDFGIAHSPDHGAGDSTTLETLANTIIGTPAYMPPEMMLGGDLGPPADVFSLGVVLYEMLTGTQPFTAATAMGVMARIANEHPLSMTMIEATIPPGLDAFVMSMLDKDPSRRPTAKQVEATLPSLASPVDPEILVNPEGASYTVGRETELAQLYALYGRVRTGKSLVVGIAGEPGIGKTTVLEAFMEGVQQAAERPIVVRVRCSENLAGSEAYLPVLEALDSLRVRGHASLDTLMRTVAPAWHAQVATSTDAAAKVTHSQERMKREFRSFLAEASRHAPLVWLIEDLHWADASTVDVLNYVAGHFEDMRVMIVAAFRLSDMTLAKHPFLAVRNDLQSKGAYLEIPLTFLSPTDIEHYLALRFPANRFPPSFVAEIHSRTEGSPLFMADLVRYVRDAGGLVEHDGVWDVSDALKAITRELPESVRGMIARKIERVSDEDRKILLGASVQGQGFDAAPLAAATGVDALDLEERLEALDRVHGLVRRGQDVEYPDGTLSARYRFVHVLYQNVLYGSLTPTRRINLCAKTAEALATHYGADTSPVAPLLAVLFAAARHFPKAAQFSLQAAQRAASLSGYRESKTLTERGLEAVAKIPETPERKRLELSLQMNLALSLRMTVGWVAPELEPVLARARLLCAELGDPPDLFPVLWNLAFFHMIRGNIPVTREHLTDLAAKAEASGNPVFRMATGHLTGVTSEFAGDVGVAIRELDASRALHEPARSLEYRAIFGMDSGMQARAMSSRSLWALGYPDRALERAKETVALAGTVHAPQMLSFSTLVQQGIHLYRGEAAEAIALGDKIIALCEEYEFPQERAWSRGFQAAAFSLVGELDRGTTQLGEALDELAELRSGLVRTMFLSLHAEALWRAGRVDAGLKVVDEGLAHAESMGEHGYHHELLRLRGELFLKQGRKADAEASMHEAIEWARRFEARSFELRAAMSLARLLAADGRAAEARGILQPVAAWFTEGKNTADLTAARTFLTSIS